MSSKEIKLAESKENILARKAAALRLLRQKFDGSEYKSINLDRLVSRPDKPIYIDKRYDRGRNTWPKVKIETITVQYFQNEKKLNRYESYEALGIVISDSLGKYVIGGEDLIEFEDGRLFYQVKDNPRENLPKGMVLMPKAKKS